MSSSGRSSSLTQELLTLGVVAGEVVIRRSLILMGGGPRAMVEAWRMIGEKVVLGLELQRCAMTGGMATDPADATHAMVRHLRQKVSANRRRLRS